MANKKTDRRVFLKKAALGTAIVASQIDQARSAEPERRAILAALGDTLIPSAPGDPGFRDLEPHGITAEVDRTLGSVADEWLAIFNRSSAPFFSGRTFLELKENERVEYLTRIISGDPFPDAKAGDVARRVYRLARIAVFRIFYSNFPENRIARDRQGFPILKPGDLHQITTPNTREVATGWDLVGYRGPLTWEQERELRARMEKIHWHKNLEDLVVRYRPRSGEKQR